MQKILDLDEPDHFTLNLLSVFIRVTSGNLWLPHMKSLWLISSANSVKDIFFRPNNS